MGSFDDRAVAFGRDIDDGLVVEVGLSQLVKIVGEIKCNITVR